MIRPSRIQFDTRRSTMAIDQTKLQRKARHVVVWALVGLFFPYVSVKTFNLLDRLPIWDQRIERKRIEKMSFDWMLVSMADKEQDIIDEFSDY